MPLSLNFRVEDRSGVMVVITRGPSDTTDLVRPASTVEVELWNALARRLAAPARESYIRVNEQDLVNVLMERDQLRRQVQTLTTKNAELEAIVNPPKPEEAHGQERQSDTPADAGGSPGGEPAT